MKLMERSVAAPSTVYWELLQTLMEYRVAMPVSELMVFKTKTGETGYYVCPRCDITLPREFVAYCDRCGQHLGWEGYKKVKIVYPGKRG